MTETGTRALGMVLGVLVAVAAALLALLAFEPASGVLIAGLAGFIGVLLACLALHRAGRPDAAVCVLVPALLGVATLACIHFGSVHSVGTTAMLGGIVAAGLFLPRAAVVATVVYAIAAVGALIAAERAGVISPPAAYRPGILQWVVLAAVMGCIGAWTHYARHLLLDALEGARASAERFTKVFNVVPLSLVISRLSDGRILDVNAADRKFLGYSRDEVLGMSTLRTAWVDPAERARLRAALERDGTASGFEAKFHNKSGEIVDAQIWSALVDIAGEPCIVSAAVNVSERKGEDRLLLELAAGVAGASGEQIFAALARHAARALDCEIAMIGELTAPGRLRTLVLSREGHTLPETELAVNGAPCGDLPADGAPRLITAGVPERYPGVATLVDARVQSHIGASLRDLEGRPIGVFSVYGFRPLAPAPRVAALFSIFAARAQSELRQLRAERDLRQMHEALEARVRERTADLESFTHSVAHDLRAPLRALSGLSSIVQENYAAALPPDVARYLVRIDRSARQMGRLVDDLLEFSRLGLVPIKQGPVDMEGLVRSLVREYSASSGGRVRFEVGAILPATGDAQLLAMVWRHLIDNAVKYSGLAAAPKVEIWSQACGEGQRYFVRDNGAGFDPQYAGKLFQMFERLHTASEFEGSGVGLAILSRIVTRHGGGVGAQGAPGAGATFTFTLPGVAQA